VTDSGASRAMPHDVRIQTPDTLVTLREYVNLQVDYLEAEDRHIRELLETKLGRMDDKFSASQIVQEARLERMNQLREMVDSVQATFVTKNTYDAKHELLCVHIQGLEESRAELRGKASQSLVILSYVLIVLSIVVNVALYVVR
jgi:hypothetical protein